MKYADALSGTTAFVSPGVIWMAAPTIDEMEDTIRNLRDEAQAIRAKADAEDRDLTDEETDEILAKDEEAEQVEKRLKARKGPAATPRGRTTSAEVQDRSQPNDTGRAKVAPTAKDTARHGFKSMGEFAQTVYMAGKRNGDVTSMQRLQNVASTFGSESVGADGGFAVPPEFRRAIWEKVNSQENLMTRCASMELAGNNIAIPKDETTPWQTSGGILAYWEGEGDATSASKPQLKLDTIRLAKLMALVPVSEELLADAPAIESWLRMKAPAKMVAKINTAIVRGTGVGQPEGILNHGSLISVAKGVSQDAASVWFENIVKMYSRLYAPWRSNAVWLINQDVEPQLLQMAFDPEATSKVPVYLPPNGVSSSPFGTLMGRPVIPVEACSTVGTQGDIIFTDLNQYLVLQKAGQGVQTDVSMHLYFDQALQAFRFIFRMNGMPLWASAISPENGSNSYSAFVTLDARA